MDEIIKQRLNKLKRLREVGVEPYGGRFRKSCNMAEAIANFKEGLRLSLAGRVMSIRSHGKAIFADIKDYSGKLQIYLKEEFLGKDKFRLLEYLDIGDFLGMEGILFKTKTKEVTLKVEGFKFLSKSLKTLPEKWHGLKDIEARYRHRHLDLIMNERTREIFLLRSKIISCIRNFLDSRGYLEVETPMMQPLPGGATGEPFKTFHKEFGVNLFLRIAPELYLKRLLVGGLERIYEINRSFRNEGISPRHNPEFTMLEVYKAYSDYEEMMKLTEDLILHLAKEILGKTIITYQGRRIDLKAPWKRLSFSRELKRRFDIEPFDALEVWVKKLQIKGKSIHLGPAPKRLPRSQVVKIVEELLKEGSLSSPVFLVDYFSHLCPLAKQKGDVSDLSERFELFIGGIELANAYSELADPMEQRKKFQQQSKIIDEDYIEALEYGMPPAGGLGIGIDRLIMLFADCASIKDVILFPQLRPVK